MTAPSVPEWIDDNIRRAQSIVDGTSSGVDRMAPPSHAATLALLALCGLAIHYMGGIAPTAEPADRFDLAGAAARSEPVTGSGVAVLAPCGCVLDWVADSAELAYRKATLEGWEARLGIGCLQVMDYEAAQPLLALGRDCPHHTEP